ncbi:MMPL family transporter [Streptomyces sp. NPDC004732]|uniref:MMPL family transporter n=1 Tax=Streptomyces sp. NPDC004732 TaxID=3154290 RepID=UPI0033B1AC11
MFSTIAGWHLRRRRVLLLLALVVAALAGAFSSDVTSRMSNSTTIYEDASRPSVTARHTISEATGTDPSQGYVIEVRTERRLSPGDPVPDAVAKARSVLRARPETVTVADYTSRGPALISDDGRGTLVVAALGPLSEKQAKDGTEAVQEAIDDEPALRESALLGGPTAARHQVGELSFSDLARAELFALPVLLLVLVLVFRGVVAALLPLVGAVFTLLLTFGGLAVAVRGMTVASGAMNLATALGLGLSIDFSLLLVTRFREELARGLGPADALRVCLGTAGRTVLFSALTVTAALAALLVFPQPYLRSMGLAGILTTVAAALFALLVLPGLLAALGTRINALPLRRSRGEAAAEEASVRRWRRRTQFIVGRPTLFGLGAVVLLVVLASPALGVRFTGVDGTSLPDSVSSGQVAASMKEHYPRASAQPVVAVAQAGPSNRARVVAYGKRLAAVDGVASVGEPRRIDAGNWQWDITVEGAPLGERAQQVVEDLAAEETVSPGLPVSFTGGAADFRDQQRSIGDRLPLALTLLGVTTFLLLFAFTGSVVLPLKTLLMNVLSTAAAVGILVLLFQGHTFEGLLGFTSQGALESTGPLLLAVLAFGLSTDYGVFLLGRIMEARAGGAAEREAVVTGLSRSGRIVTSAAALFCIPVAALALSRVVLIKELGLGTAFAVFLDAALIRTVLVPSLMALMGSWNWWAPGPLRRLHTSLGLDRLHRAETSAGLPEPELVGTPGPGPSRG